MAHTVMRGLPTISQLYLEGIIQELLKETGCEEDRYRLNRILFKCLRDHPDRLLLIDGKTDEKIKNGEMLRRAVQVARAMESHNLKPGDVAVAMAQNHIDYSTLYYGVLFSGVTLFNLEPVLTSHEVQHYVKLTKSAIVFADSDKIELMKKALKNLAEKPEFVIFGEKNSNTDMTFSEFIEGHSDDPEGYWPVEVVKDAAALFFTTGGSTGLGPPKIAPNTNEGLIAVAFMNWHHITDINEFPQSSERMLVVYHGQWTVHTMTLTSAVMYGASLLMQSQNPTGDNISELCKKYKPTWILITPPDATNIIKSSKYRRGDLHSIKTFVLVGVPPSKNMLTQLKEELSPEATICNRYGMTEAHGYVCVGDKHEPPALDLPLNVFLYKILDANGKPVEVNKPGELYLKSNYCLSKTYYGDEEAAKNMYTPDGWFRTGDIMRIDENGVMHYIDRLKFILYNRGYAFSPLEVEELIRRVKGVADAVVVSLDDKGPIALVVPQNGVNPSREAIKDAVKAELNFHKHLSGVGFINALPRSSVGKLQRRKCAEIIKEMIADKQCY